MNDAVHQTASGPSNPTSLNTNKQKRTTGAWWFWRELVLGSFAHNWLPYRSLVAIIIAVGEEGGWKRVSLFLG